jgi:gamma-glutamyltranspeptidase / glutathione hydrolase
MVEESLNAASPAVLSRPEVMATRHAVSSGHYWSSQAAMQILEAGGNAIDAGVAAGIATNVLESQFTGFAGVAPTMIYLAKEDRVLTISGVGPWPKAASCDYFHKHHGGRVPDGLLNTVVPSTPAIWLLALEKFGTMSFGEVAAAGIRFARDGFPMYPMFRDRVADARASFEQWPTTAAVFLPNGDLPPLGELFFQTDMAKSLQYMVDEEAATSGRIEGLAAARAAFYEGDIAAAMTRHQAAEGGLMTMADMADYRAEIETPLKIRFGDTELYGCGPWSQGPMVLQALNLLDGFDLKAMGHNSAQYVHSVCEAMKLAAADREYYYGDPNFVDVPMSELLSADYTARRRDALRADVAWPELPPAGEVAGRTPPPWTPDPSTLPANATVQAPAFETSHLDVIDRHGNIFAATPSDPVTSGPITPGTGLTASQWGSRAHTDPNHAAAVGPGRRPRMSANPMLARRDGDFIMGFGSPGSEVLGQAQLQVFLNVSVFGMSPQAAVDSPRFASYSWPASALPHTYLPGRLNLEAEIYESAGGALGALGHKIEPWPSKKWSAGSVAILRKNLKTGVIHAGADPRRTAYAAGW